MEDGFDISISGLCSKSKLLSCERRRRGSSAFQIRPMQSNGMLSIIIFCSETLFTPSPSMIEFEVLTSMEIEIARAFDWPSP